MSMMSCQFAVRPSCSADRVLASGVSMCIGVGQTTVIIIAVAVITVCVVFAVVIFFRLVCTGL